MIIERIKEHVMIRFEQGQCGTCMHFGEHGGSEELTQLRIEGNAPDDYTNQCGLPSLAEMNLVVSANSTCDGYEAA